MVDVKKKREQAVELFQKIADLTAPGCAGEGPGACRVPHSCCSPEYCASTIEYAKEFWNVELKPTDHPKLPLMGPSGCIAAPHVRPMCAVHLCQINGLGFTKDPEFNEQYFKLREKADIVLLHIEAEKL